MADVHFEEMLEILKPLGSVNGEKLIFTWPAARPIEGVWVKFADEFARITKTWTWQARWGNDAALQDAVDRCNRTGAELVIIDSPDLPPMEEIECPCSALKLNEERWAAIKEKVKIPVKLVVFDQETWSYGDFDKNNWVSRLNEKLYKFAKNAFGNECLVTLYGHLSNSPSPSWKYGPWWVSRYSSWTDKCDTGFDLTWYSPLNKHKELACLNETIKYSVKNKIVFGSIWQAVGATMSQPFYKDQSVVRKATSGMDWIRLDTSITHHRISLICHPYWREIKNDRCHRNEFLPALSMVKQVGVFPGLGRLNTEFVIPHIVAFLIGALALPLDCKDRLNEIQDILWSEGSV